MSVMTMVVVVALASLGRWQLRRADEKQVLYDAFDKGADATRELGSSTPPVARYQHVQARGSYDSTRQILIDNMTDANGHAGYYVITPLALDGGSWVLVNRGWISVGPSRATLPAIEVTRGDRIIRGRADHLPTPGIQMGVRAEMHPPYPVVANFPSHDEIARLLAEGAWTPATDVVLLDADQADGYTRDWRPPGFPPMRNLAYAVQWFGLALAVATLYVVTNLRRVADRKPT